MFAYKPSIEERTFAHIPIHGFPARAYEQEPVPGRGRRDLGHGRESGTLSLWVNRV